MPSYIMYIGINKVWVKMTHFDSCKKIFRPFRLHIEMNVKVRQV